MARTYKFKSKEKREINPKKIEYLRTKKREKTQLKELVKEYC